MGSKRCGALSYYAIPVMRLSGPEEDDEAKGIAFGVDVRLK
jgi:hypothetical protein